MALWSYWDLSRHIRSIDGLNIGQRRIEDSRGGLLTIRREILCNRSTEVVPDAVQKPSIHLTDLN